MSILSSSSLVIVRAFSLSLSFRYLLLALSSALNFVCSIVPSCLWVQIRYRLVAFIHIRGSSTAGATSISSASTCIAVIPDWWVLSRGIRMVGDSWLASHSKRAWTASSLSSRPSWLHRGHRLVRYVVERILWSLSIVGRIPHIIFSRKDENTGPRPLSLAFLQAPGQSSCPVFPVPQRPHTVPLGWGKNHLPCSAPQSLRDPGSVYIFPSHIFLV